MKLRWPTLPKRIKTKSRTKPKAVHYLAHKDKARSLVIERIEYWNQIYQVKYNRISIKNQKRRWGSCSSLGNLNFNYKIIFLPPTLADYIIVHELCHLLELNHSVHFWRHVARTIPDYRERQAELRYIEKNYGTTIKSMEIIQSKLIINNSVV